MHPELEFDLTAAMVEAAHEIGVLAPIYITVGWSALDEWRHPEWVAKNMDGTPQGSMGYDVTQPGDAAKPLNAWANMCPGGGYGVHIQALTEEICLKFKVLDGLFYDINFLPPCWCDHCVAAMLELGLNPEDVDDAQAYNVLKWRKFNQSCHDLMKRHHPDSTLFHNGGANPFHAEYHDWNTHFEIEDLPTSWGGYDKFPLRARFFARSGKDYLAMTGKFHTFWGEFGGYKAPKALYYECAAMLAFGACCSVGDQLHPTGMMDMATYRILGQAYEYVEKIEPFCRDASETSKLAVMMCPHEKSMEGVVRMLLDLHLDFDLVREGDSLEGFDTVILPDEALLDIPAAEQLRRFSEAGGGVLLTGRSGLDIGQNQFLIDTGSRWEGPSQYRIDYIELGAGLREGLVDSPFLAYEAAGRSQVTDGETLASIREPYFDRTYAKYCSHQYTPYRPERAQHPACVRKGRTVHLAHPLFRMYQEFGAQLFRDYFARALVSIQPTQVLEVQGLPAAGRVRLACQSDEKRHLLHVLYAPPIQRGSTLVIDDMPVLHDVVCRLRIDRTIRKVRLVPQMTEIPWTLDAGQIQLLLPPFSCHQMVVLDWAAESGTGSHS